MISSWKKIDLKNIKFTITTILSRNVSKMDTKTNWKYFFMIYNIFNGDKHLMFIKT